LEFELTEEYFVLIITILFKIIYLKQQAEVVCSVCQKKRKGLARL